jgi:hypothetical protein
MVNWSTKNGDGNAASGLFIVATKISALAITLSYLHIIWISKHGLRQVYEVSYKLYAGTNGSTSTKNSKVILVVFTWYCN